MTIEEILHALTVVREGTFPEAALLAAREQQDDMIPQFLNVLKTSPSELNQICNSTDHTEGEIYWLFDFATYLLAEFKVQEAYPLLVHFFSTAEKLPDFCSDLITDNIGRIWASTFNGDMEALLNIINNVTINSLIRLSAVETLVILNDQSQVDEEKVILFFLECMEQYAWKDDLEFAALFVSTVADIKSTRLKPSLEKMFDDEQVDLSTMSKADLDSVYSGEDSIEILPLITDAIEELKQESWFHISAEREAASKKFFDELELSASLEKKMTSEIRQAKERLERLQRLSAASMVNHKSPETYHRETPKVGRNDLCACGSGKKYKKCCLKN